MIIVIIPMFLLMVHNGDDNDQVMVGMMMC